MKKPTVKSLRNELDKLWRTVGKEMAVCAICASGWGVPYNYNQLHPHHMISRRKSLTRWELRNRLWVCPSHHTLSDQCVEYNQKGWFWNDKSDKDWLGVCDPKLKKWLQKMSIETNKTKKWTMLDLEEKLKELQSIKSY